MITKSIPLKNGSIPKINLNAAGLGNESALRVEILDHLESPLAAYSGVNAAIVRENGFQVPVSWAEEKSGDDLPDRVRLRLVFEGEKRTSIRLSAIYLRQDETS